MSEEEALEELQKLVEWMEDLLYDDEVKCSTKIRYAKLYIQGQRQQLNRQTKGK